MKKIMLFCAIITGISAFAQSNTPFKMPAEIKFEKNIVQKINDNKKDATVSYYFTKSGDYAALKPEDKDGTLIIYAKDGTMLVVNDKEKSIIIMNLGKFITEAAKAGREIAKNKTGKDSVSAADIKTNFRKTGNTKTISGYTAEEYEIKKDNDVMLVWYLKADFDANLFSYMGLGKMPNMPAAKNTAPAELSNFPALGKNYFMAEMSKNGKKIIETVSIADANLNFSSAGYTVRDMSSLMKGNYQ